MDLDNFYKLFISQQFKYSTDSRSIEKGDIFFALKGENFNGNKYALQALEQGASYVVVDENIGTDLRIIQVGNVLKFFQEVSNFQRRAFSIPVIAIAGSNGKTTTKNLVADVLRKKFRTHVTSGNFNNHIGVPVTLLNMPQDTEIAVIEIGTNSPGEIKELCRICEPNYGLITNIGKEHLEGFNSLEAVAKEESELYHYLLTYDGTAFVNADDEWLMRMSKLIEKRVLYSKADIQIRQLVPSILADFGQIHIHSALMGDYNLDNILAAISIAKHFGVDDDDIQQAINEYAPDNNRSQLMEIGDHFIWLDAYNANPSSMQKAIENFNLMNHKTKVLVLGDMFELGKFAQEEHLSLLAFCKELGFKDVFLLGSEFERVSAELGYTTYNSMEELGAALQSLQLKQAAFLIKGSRGMKMERVLDYIGS